MNNEEQQNPDEGTPKSEIPSWYNQQFNAIRDEVEALKNLFTKNDQKVNEFESTLMIYRTKMAETQEKYIETVNKLEHEVELQKLYCYIISKLVDSCGLELDDDFDITDYSCAEKLYKYLKYNRNF